MHAVVAVLASAGFLYPAALMMHMIHHQIIPISGLERVFGLGQTSFIGNR